MTGRRHALLIGTENYLDEGFARLPSTRADTEQLGAVLRDRTIGGFEVTTSLDLTATEMRAAIREFCFERSVDDLALIFITGHGARDSDGRFVFVARDTDACRLADTGVRAETVNDDLEGCHARRRIAIFDTCDSGSFAVGLRSSGPTARGKRSAPQTANPPMTPSCVYVLASCDATESAYEGGGTLADPEPSVFTGAMVDVLRTGAAGASAQGAVSVDDLFEAVVQRLRGTDPPQTPVKSAVRVSGAITIAARPLGGTVRPVDELDRPPSEVVADGSGVPDRPGLFAYYSDVVRSELDDVPPMMTVHGPDHVVLRGAERALCGIADADGCIPAPEGSEQMIRASRERNGPQLWMGWPAVVLYDREPVFAPLLIRLVEVVDGLDGTKLRAEGPVLPHPGLMARRLGQEDVELLRSSYRASWHRGEYDRMAFDAGQLLEDTFTLPCVEVLRPDALATYIDLATANEGARNVGVLFTIKASSFTSSLLKDLEDVCRNPTAIEDTALIALYPGSEDLAAHPRPGRGIPPLVTPLAANPAQRAVLQSAMNRRLTVATGPPGTGKSQLVADVVATAVAAGETVLVASTNNEAVNEVHGRCARMAPGMLIRTGSQGRRAGEADELGKLSMAQRLRPNTETRRHALLQAGAHRKSLDERLAVDAGAERELLALCVRVRAHV